VLQVFRNAVVLYFSQTLHLKT